VVEGDLTRGRGRVSHAGKAGLPLVLGAKSRATRSSLPIRANPRKNSEAAAGAALKRRRAGGRKAPGLSRRKRCEARSRPRVERALARERAAVFLELVASEESKAQRPQSSLPRREAAKAS